MLRLQSVSPHMALFPAVYCESGIQCERLFLLAHLESSQEWARFYPLRSQQRAPCIHLLCTVKALSHSYCPHFLVSLLGCWDSLCSLRLFNTSPFFYLHKCQHNAGFWLLATCPELLFWIHGDTLLSISIVNAFHSFCFFGYYLLAFSLFSWECRRIQNLYGHPCHHAHRITHHLKNTHFLPLCTNLGEGQ
jgi:hypothetical protein